MADSDYQIVKQMSIPFPRQNVVHTDQPLPEFRREEYMDGKVIALTGRLPTYDEYADARSEETSTDVDAITMRPLFEREGIRSKWELTKRVLEMSQEN